jgi:hypothetical protein
MKEPNLFSKLLLTEDKLQFIILIITFDCPVFIKGNLAKTIDQKNWRLTMEVVNLFLFSKTVVD